MKLFGRTENSRDAGKTSASIRLGFTVCIVLALFLVICGSAGADNSTLVTVTPTDIVNTTVVNPTQAVIPVTTTSVPIDINGTAATPTLVPGTNFSIVIPTLADVIATFVPTPVPTPAAAVVNVATAGISGTPVVTVAPVATEPVIIDPVMQQAVVDHKVMPMHNITAAQRLEAAKEAAAKGLGSTTSGASISGGYSIQALPAPGGVPDYFGSNPNYATSQLPMGNISLINVDAGGVGYLTTPNVTIADAYNTGSGATAVAGVTAGAVTSITVTNPGRDYTAPIITIVSNTTGVGAAASAVVNGSVRSGIRKFVDSLPGLTSAGANNLGQYIPVAQSDTAAYPGSDYYEIALVEYSEKMHSDISPTLLRGYVQVESPFNRTGSLHVQLFYPNGQPILNSTGSPVFAYDKPHYLGPIIVSQKDVATRIKFHNYISNGTAGNLFIPTDTTIMGAGMGPDGVNSYAQNRATIHLHGGNTPWISDGTPHQWTTPANEITPYPKGVSVSNVPDMDGGVEPAGTLTFYYTNQQSARLMFYHDHVHGITRLNVYAGEAAGYLVRDASEQAMITAGTLPSGANEIPLVIQDKSFVPNASQMLVQDPTWNWGNKSLAWPYTGSLYYNHVYMPLQNPFSGTQVNPMGRWDYGPWVWPGKMGFLNQPVANPYFGAAAPWEPPVMPATPNPSQTPESFMDTPIVNGAAYPYVQVGPHAYRFRILNAANDRTLNLGLYYAASNGTMWSGTTLLNGTAGEVNMVPAAPNTGLPANWPVDNRVGGVPDPAAAGPSWIQIGTEGGFLPAPAIIPPQPITYDTHLRSALVVNTANHSLMLMPAQRADVIVDFTGIPDGTKLILYNDMPAPSPGGDSRYDFYTGDPAQTAIGGAPTTLLGYGPNTRTVMQIRVNASIVGGAPLNLAALNTALPVAYKATQDPPIVPQSVYNATYPANNFVNSTATSMTFTPVNGTVPVTMPLANKAIIGNFEMVYGRLTALLGTEIPRSATNIESAVPSQYNDPPTEILNESYSATQIGTLADGTQIWRVTNNDVDLHPLHFHMFNLQVINRVFWDGTVVAPEANEVGWKETINTPPMMDTIVAMRAIKPIVPFDLPNSIRLLDPTSPAGTTLQFTGLDPTGGQAPTVNHLVNFGWEYVYHCHILGHEENDFMRPLSIAVSPRLPPSNVTALKSGTNTTPTVNLTWKDNSNSETNWTVQRATVSTGPWTDIAMAPSITGPAAGGFANYTDRTVAPNTTYYYRVLATNVVGDTTTYAWTAGYPTMIVNSTPSVVAGVLMNRTADGTIDLNAGWNFISTPKRLAAGNNTFAIFANVNTSAHSIWNFTATTQRWRAMVATNPVVPLEGYWIYSNRTTSVALFYDTNPILAPPSKTLAAGWNAIGFSDVTPTSAHNALASVNTQWSVQMGFNSSTQMFDTSVINGGTGTHSDTTLMLPTKGYWVNMNLPGTLAAIGA